MKTIAFLAFVILFSWYLVDEVYSEQPKSVANSYPHEVERTETPELTAERIELLRKIAGISNEDVFPSVNAGRSSDAYTLHTSFNGIVTIPTSSRPVNEVLVHSISSEWEANRSINEYSGIKEGSAVSAWTRLSPSLTWTDDSIQAALVAGCNEEGEKSLNLKLLSAYPISDVSTVKGQVKWDSSSPYHAPFTYNQDLNTLRLQSGLDDSLSLIRAAKKVSIQIPWHDDQQAIFTFSLKGSSRAVNAAFGYCNR